MHKRTVSTITTILCILIFTAPSVQSQDHIIQLEPSPEPIHIRVLFEQHPDSEAQVSWTTTLEGSSHTLYYDREPRNGDTTAYRYQSGEIHTGKYALRPEEVGMDSWYHHAFMENLEPATK